jgi:hypothetical protein
MQVWLRPPGAEDNTLGTAEDLLKEATGGVAQVFRYWDRKRGTRAMPSPDDIDFLELRPWLSGIMLIEVVSGRPRELIYRVVGERAVRQRGYDPSGMSVRQAAYGDPVAEVLANYGVVVDRRMPLYFWNERKARPDLVSNTLALPLSRDGAEVDRVLVYGEDHPAERPD